MSKRAEEAALKAYPPTYSTVKRHAKRVQSELVDTHKPVRAIFQQGYEQAAKEVMKQIHKYVVRRLIANREEIGLSTYAAGRTEEDKLIMDYIEKLEKEYE